ncbi:hypothetical protein JTE90_020047 [Oedothorax gibbosus]|uniref:Uncharacterized protein n=1 Tax=Oedothorax gibbosus TaxID=931172 RepID=A0AAV6UUJ1_9ARAC|nr:hypothetical protein JTE90_020047 [Oedothorax gibbosus]
MLMQYIFVVSVFSTYAAVIDGNAISYPTSNGTSSFTDKEKYSGHREKRQINIFGFNTDFRQILARTISSINLIRDTFLLGRDLGNTLSNAFNPSNGTEDATGVFSNSPLRLFQDRFEQLRKRTRDALWVYMKRMGLVSQK